MRVVHLSTYDRRGGAAKAAARLHDGLLRAGIDSQLVVQWKEGGAAAVHGYTTRTARATALLRPHIDALPLLLHKASKENTWSFGWLKNRTLKRTQRLNPDLINLHWVGHGFLPIDDVPRLGVPVVWTFHDSWAFTGGCHVPLECSGYRESCGYCRDLGSHMPWDLSRWVWKRKKRHWMETDFTVVSPSRWMAECVESSRLFASSRVEIIPNALDLGVFKPIDRNTARSILNIPHDRRIILSGAVGFPEHPWKGAAQLREALEMLASAGWNERAELVIFGASTPVQSPFSGFAARHVGVIYDDVTLALYYAAADVFVCPSLSETLGYTVMESMACGTPVAAFNVGGIPDLVEHKISGYLAQPFDSGDLAKGIAWIIEGRSRNRELSGHARRAIEETCASDKVVRRYVQLYDDVLRRTSHGRPGVP